MSLTYRAAVDTTLSTVATLEELFEATRQRNSGLSSRDRALMTIVRLRDHPTLQHLADSFGCSIGTSYNITTAGTALLAEYTDSHPGIPQVGVDMQDVLDDPPGTDGMLDEVSGAGHVNTDGTFIHTQNSWLQGHFNHKHRNCGVVFLTVATPSGVPLWFSEPRPGSVHDMALLKDSGILAVLEAAGVGVVADKGFQGLDPGLHLTPVKKPKGGRLSAAQREHNRWVSRLRIPVETVFARLKQYKVLVKCRLHVSKVGVVLRAVLALHYLEGRTW